MIRAVRQYLPSLGDVLLTVLPLGFVLGVTSGANRWQHDAPRLDTLGYLWLIACALPLLVARRFPLSAFAVTGVLTVAYYAVYDTGGPAAVLPTIALFLLTRDRGPLIAGIAGTLAIGIGFYGVHLATGGTLVTDARAALPIAWIAAVVGIGTAVRNRIAANRAAREQAVEHQERMAEQERLRIAREVHDVVAHSLAMINVQAGVAAHVADRRPEQAKEALRNIKEASAAALTDLRATLAVLRGQDHAPAPSLDQMAELLEHTRTAGLTVRVHGSPGNLPAPTDAAAYRILQESLTNVVRHANQPKHVDVHFGRDGGSLELVVRDDGMGATEPKIGNGLRGMRERAEALGGRVRATAVEGGFEVRAELPIQEEHR
ncbi:sensor histidine kinase [Amycolatopsis anabasis]|uniref:sensor histidine kinase n=1 Tax=Amycolatopsis anabasis TaxID=1840409 RepID=UPI001FE4F0C5|nr:sensor histidine kinase [Amycolatopsis anabasis]